MYFLFLFYVSVHENCANKYYIYIEHGLKDNFGTRQAQILECQTLLISKIKSNDLKYFVFCDTSLFDWENDVEINIFP